MDYLQRGLVQVANARTEGSLGDRSVYIGASDLAKGCFRQAVLDKLVPRPTHSLSELLTFERGHWQEEGLKAAFEANGAKILHQLEIAFTTGKGTQCRFHLDLVIITKTKTIIVESKSFRSTPADAPYESHKAQISMQVAAFDRFWDQPAFRLAGSETELVSFPELIAEKFSSPIEKKVEGWLLCVGADKAQPYGPYDPGTDEYWAEVLNYADTLWDAVSRQSSKVRYKKGLYPLCDYCAHAQSCPKFDGQELEQYADGLQTFQVIKASIKCLKNQEEELKENLIAVYKQLDGKLNGYLQTSAGSFCVRQETRNSIRKEKLIQALSGRGFSPSDVEAILAEASENVTYDKLVTSAKKAEPQSASVSIPAPATQAA
jgi:hypothetical protein